MSHVEEHRKAVQAGQLGYIDSTTGLFVMTENYLRERGRCCGNGCRHCPFGRSLPEGDTSDTNQLILPSNMDRLPQHCVTLFWSGGKDSYLAYLELNKTEQNILLCTTYANGMVGHQEIPVERIISQAKQLDAPLLLIALKSDERYEHRVSNALRKHSLDTLAFGDLHLEEIRGWRLRFFKDYTLLFPIWQVPYSELLDRLWESPGIPIVSAVGDHLPDHVDITVGETYSPSFVEKIRTFDIDLMGENGEFHTEITFGHPHQT